MKKTIFAIALGCIALVSCKKDYSCTCTETEVEDGESDAYSYTYKVEGATKTEAQAACNEAKIIYVEGTYTSTESCSLSK